METHTGAHTHTHMQRDIYMYICGRDLNGLFYDFPFHSVELLLNYDTRLYYTYRHESQEVALHAQRSGSSVGGL